MKPESSDQNHMKRLRKILEFKLAAFRKFYTATEVLIKSINDGDIDRIGNILDERQACINTINKLNAQFTDVKEENPFQYNPSQFNALMGEINQTVNESIYLNKECTLAAANQIYMLQKESLNRIQKRNDFRNCHKQNSIEGRFLNIAL